LETNDTSKDSAAPSGQLDPIEKKKEELFAKLNVIAERLKEKRKQADELHAALRQKTAEVGINPRELRKEMQRLDFQISTEATTLQKEREMMKVMREMQKKLSKAVEVEKLDRQFRLVIADIRADENEIEDIKKGIGEAKSVLKEKRDAQFEERREQRNKEWEEKKRKQLLEHRAKRDSEIKKENEPFIGGLDPDGVDLGSIAVIKKRSE